MTAYHGMTLTHRQKPANDLEFQLSTFSSSDHFNVDIILKVAENLSVEDWILTFFKPQV